MGAMASQFTSLMIVYSIVYSGADQWKHESSVSLAFVLGIHRLPVNSQYKGQLRRKCYHLMTSSWCSSGLPHCTVLFGTSNVSLLDMDKSASTKPQQTRYFVGRTAQEQAFFLHFVTMSSSPCGPKIDSDLFKQINYGYFCSRKLMR